MFNGVVFPIDRARVTLPFGATNLPPYYTPERPHRGVDLAPFPGSVGEPIYAPVRGRVTNVRYHPAAGNDVFITGSVPFEAWARNLAGQTVTIAAGQEFVMRFSHLDRVDVVIGQDVTPGQGLGTIGMTGTWATGPHLHHELALAGQVLDPMDFYIASIVGLKDRIEYAV